MSIVGTAAHGRTPASMGPLPGGSGNTRIGQGNRSMLQASMGPLPGGSGNKELVEGLATVSMLQWGRFPEEAEIAPLLMPVNSMTYKALFERVRKTGKIGHKTQGEMANFSAERC